MASMSFLVNDSAALAIVKPTVKVTITENADGTVTFVVAQLAGYVGDLRGFFFDIADESLLGSLKAGGTGLSNMVQGNDTIVFSGLGLGANMIGLSGRDCGYDVGVDIGSFSTRPGDDYRSFAFTLDSTKRDLKIADFSNVDFGVSVTSIGRDANLDGHFESLRLFSAKLGETTFATIKTTADVARVDESRALSGNVLSNDGASVGDTLTVARWSGGALGTDIAFSDLANARVRLNANGSYTVDASASESLATGQTASRVFTYDVLQTNVDGTSTQTVSFTVTITGTNDGPTIVMSATDAVGALTEDVAAASLQDSGVIVFDDLDLTDVHTVSVAPGTGNRLGGSLTIGSVAESATTREGSVGWTYSVANSAVQYLAKGQTQTETYVVTVADGQGGSVQQTVAVTVTGTNDLPSIAVSTQALGAVTEDATPTLTAAGTIVFNDVDLIDAHTASVAAGLGNKLSGTLVLGAVTESPTTEGGTVGWTYSLPSSGVHYLAQGETQTETYVVTIADGQGGSVQQTVSVTITGTNDAPIITAEDLAGAVIELVSPSGNLTDSGTIEFTDVDLTDQHLVNVSPVGSGVLGRLSAVKDSDTTATGTGGQLTWAYSVAASAVEYLAAGQTRVEDFTITLDDQNGGVITKTISVTITGTNDAPVISYAGTETTTVLGGVTAIGRSLTETNAALTTSGTLTVTDVDASNIVSAEVVGVAGGGAGYNPANALGFLSLSPALVLDAGEASDSLGWNFSAGTETFDFLAQGLQTRLTYTIRVIDSAGATADQLVTVLITGTNDAPVVTGAITGTATEDGAASTLLALANASDIDAGATLSVVNLPATLPAGVTYDAASISFTLNPSNAAFQSLAQGSSTTISVAYGVSDGLAVTAASASWTLTGTNDAPVIDVAASVVTGTAVEDAAIAAPTILPTSLPAETVTLITGLIPLSAAQAVPINMVAVLTAVQAQLGTGATPSDAITAVWQVLDANYSSYYLPTVNEAFARLGIEYAEYLQAGGAPLTDRIAKFTPDTNSNGVPQRLQSLHDNLLGNLNDVGLRDRFVSPAGGDPRPAVYAAVVDALDDTGLGALLYRPVYSGNEGVVNLSAAFDQANGILPAARGQLVATDVDLGDALTWSAAVTEGTYGRFSIAPQTGIWTYTLDKARPATQALANGASMAEAFTVTVTDRVGASVQQTVTLTVTGTNDGPVIGAETLTGTVEELGTPDGKLTDSGTIQFTDVDLTDEHVVSASPLGSGVLGSLSVVKVSDTTGTGVGGQLTWSYSVDASAVEHLAAGQTNVDSFALTLDDQNGGEIIQTIAVTITGTNDAPVLAVETVSAGIAELGSNVDTGQVTVSGTLAFTDVDRADSAHAVSVIPSASALGTLTATKIADSENGATGAISWSYAVDGSAVAYLAAGEAREETFSVTLRDRATGGLSDTATVTVTVTGTNDVPVITNAASARLGAVTESGNADDGTVLAGSSTVSGQLDASDVDVGATRGWSVQGAPSTNYGSLAVDATTGKWTYTLDNGKAATQGLKEAQIVTEAYTVRVTDDQGAYVDQTVTITINGTNDVPAITGSATRAVDTGATVQGQLAATDVDDGTALTYAVVGTAPAGFALDPSGSYSFDASVPAYQNLGAGQTATVNVPYTVTDERGAANVSNLVITVTGTNDLPLIITAGNLASDVAGEVAEDAQPVDALAGQPSFSPPDVAVLADGGHVVVWGVHSPASGIVFDIYQQRYDVAGRAVDSAERVNTTTANIQFSASVAAVGDGWVVTWDSYQPEAGGDNTNIYQRVYQANGTGGAEVRVNATVSGSQDGPNIASLDLPGGGYVITWTGNPTAPSGNSDIFAQRFNANGSPNGGQITVNAAAGDEYTDGYQTSSIAGLPGGGFVVVWQDRSSGHGEVFARVYDANGSATGGGAFKVNTDIAGEQSGEQLYASVGAVGSGFVVTWTSAPASAAAYTDIYARRYDATGAPLDLAGEVRVNSYTPSDQTFSKVVGLPGGDGYVVLWRSIDAAGTGNQQISGQRFLADGLADGGEFIVNNDFRTAAGYHSWPALAVRPDGAIVAAWNNSESRIEQKVFVEIASETTPIAAITAGTAPITLRDSGTIFFTDVNLNDPHTVNVAPMASNLLGGNLTTADVLESDTTAGGSLRWSYALANGSAQRLAQGQTVTERFTVSINDGRGGVASTEVVITVTGTNDQPVARHSLIATNNNTDVTGQLGASDVDATDALAFTLAQAPTHGTLVLDMDGSYRYTPMSGYSGADSFVYLVNDGQGGQVTANASIAVVGAGGAAQDLAGGDGNDSFLGSGLADSLSGAGAQDRLDGQGGDDVLSGGAGSDTFVFGSDPGAGNVDQITDFVSGTDQFEFVASGAFASLSPGLLEATALDILGDATAPTADTRVVYDPATGALYLDPDGNGVQAAVQLATLTNLPPTLTPDDFTVTPA